MVIKKSYLLPVVVVLGLALAGLSAELRAQSNPDLRILSFSVSGNNLDTSTTIEVLVNIQPYGYLVVNVANQVEAEQVACVDVADLTTNENDNQIRLREVSSGKTWNVVDFAVATVPEGEVCSSTLSAFVPLPANPDRLQGSSQAFGVSYDRPTVTEVPITFNLNHPAPTPGSFDGIAVQRDVRVKFITKHGATAAASNRTLVDVNGVQRLTTETYSSGNERSYDFIINRNFLSLGTNTFVFKPSFVGANKPWGIRNISIEYIAPIELTPGVIDTQAYGYSATPTRFTGLRANFSMSEAVNDYGLMVTAGSINITDEAQVFVNGNSVGFLTPGGNGFNAGDDFILDGGLLQVGVNQIEFVQRYPDATWFGPSREPWTVKDISVGVLTPDLKVTDVQILDRVISRNRPFEVSAVVTNSGGIDSDVATLKFFASADAAFNNSDTLIGSNPLAPVMASSSVTSVNSLQTTLVNKGLFLIVCAEFATDEITLVNNCSTGIPLKAVTVIPPITFLLDE